MIQSALISVSDKTGLVEFAKELAAMNVSILSTGGTAELLKKNGIAVTEVADYTGFPEMMDGRVKTLHPKVHGGILARRDMASHMDAIAKHGINTIDMVVVNLYPFQQTVAKEDCTLEDAIENIDIGGPAMLRSAAKNYKDVAVVCDPADYADIIAEMKKNDGSLSTDTKFELSKKTFSHTAQYDGAIANYMSSLKADKKHQNRKAYPEILNLQFEKVQDMRYGENPHQSAAFYREKDIEPGTLASYRQLQGKELSYNNISDADAAWECVKNFDEPACVIIKHANPCGVAVGKDLLDAYQKALKLRDEKGYTFVHPFDDEDVIAGQGTIGLELLEQLPELDAVIVANNIARQVEGKIAYRRAIKMAIANTMRMGAEGIKIQISGRLNGAEMARSEMYKEGRTPLHTFRADIDYCHAEALTKVGLLGIKVWICRGEVYGKKELAPNFTQSKESGRGSNSGNNGGKNFKRKKNNR